MIYNPFMPYIAGAALLASLVTGYKIRDWQCDAALTKAMERAAKQEREIRDELDERSRAYETLRSQTDGMGAARATDIRTIYREVPAPAPSCRAPDGVVSVLQGGINSANAAATGQSGE